MNKKICRTIQKNIPKGRAMRGFQKKILKQRPKGKKEFKKASDKIEGYYNRSQFERMMVIYDVSYLIHPTLDVSRHNDLYPNSDTSTILLIRTAY
jgi:hypothetical protein